MVAISEPIVVFKILDRQQLSTFYRQMNNGTVCSDTIGVNRGKGGSSSFGINVELGGSDIDNIGSSLDLGGTGSIIAINGESENDSTAYIVFNKLQLPTDLYDIPCMMPRS